MKMTRVFLIVLAGAGAVPAQDTPMTGTLKAAGVSTVRVKQKIQAGALTLNPVADTFGGAFSSTDLSRVIKGEPAEVTNIGPCNVSKLGQQQTPAGDTGAVTYLDAGPFLNLTGPEGSKQIPGSRLLYGAMLGGGPAIPGQAPPSPLFLNPGDYTLDNGGGGADVGPFRMYFTIPPDFEWTNADSVSPIDRATGVDITWKGGDPNSKVAIGGSVVIIDPVTRKVSGGAVFSCLEDNGTGHFNVPPEVLQLLPATVVTGGVPNGTMLVADTVTTQFDLPGFDLSEVTFGSSTTRSVELK
jgi:hypothetical protein